MLDTRPADTEFAPYYAGYVAQVPEGDLLATLRDQLRETLALVRALPEERGTHRYAPDKWSIKDVLGHIIDTERVMSYRALRIARGDTTPLPGFDQDLFVAHADSEARTLASLASELEHVRMATIALLEPMGDDALARRGVASDREVTTRGLAYIIAGHERHHVRILRERYL